MSSRINRSLAAHQSDRPRQPPYYYCHHRRRCLSICTRGTWRGLMSLIATVTAGQRECSHPGILLPYVRDVNYANNREGAPHLLLTCNLGPDIPSRYRYCTCAGADNKCLVNFLPLSTQHAHTRAPAHPSSCTHYLRAVLHYTVRLEGETEVYCYRTRITPLRRHLAVCLLPTIGINFLTLGRIDFRRALCPSAEPHRSLPFVTSRAPCSRRFAPALRWPG
jgi:hypothetical protein